MNALQTIQTSFPLKNQTFFKPRKVPRKAKPSICCKPDDSKEPEPPSPSEGDIGKQELLAKIAMLQAQKVRLTDFLDERSAYLTQFAEDANTEFDEIGKNALKGLEEAETRIMEKIESRMQAFEENEESNRDDREKNEELLAEFEDNMEKDRNEGLFFKNLGQKTPSSEGAFAEEEMQKLREVERENAGSKTRRSIYLGLICLLAVTILNGVITSPQLDWRKIAALGVIMVALIAQLTYEQRMSSATEKTVEEEQK